MSRFLASTVLTAFLLGANGACAQVSPIDTGSLETLPPARLPLETVSHLVTRTDSVISVNTRRSATRSKAMRIVVSIADRRLWVVSEQDTLLDAPVAVGMGRTLSYGGKRWAFATPLGVCRVLAKRSTPYWRAPGLGHAGVRRRRGGGM